VDRECCKGCWLLLPQQTRRGDLSLGGEVVFYDGTLCRLLLRLTKRSEGENMSTVSLNPLRRGLLRRGDLWRVYKGVYGSS
jgi:hypothetical protein